MKVSIITGITGQDGAYLAELLLRKNHKVFGVIRPEKTPNISGLKYLNIFEKIELISCDLLNYKHLKSLIQKTQPSEIYNLAAQSSVSFSFQNPKGTFHFNTMSVYNLLEAIREINPNIKFYQASSSEMFGKVNQLPITENSILHPLSPYAISKAAAHFTCVNYRESYNLKVSCGILFNHESYLRQSSFFIKKIIQQSLNIKNGQQNILEVGNIDIKRDFGYAPKYVEAMYLMLQQNEFKDYLVCSGTSITLRSIIEYVFSKLNIKLNRLVQSEVLYRPSEINDIYGSNAKAKNELNWDYNLSFYEVIDLLIEEEIKNYKN